jgi:hypothetical protein
MSYCRYAVSICNTLVFVGKRYESLKLTLIRIRTDDIESYKLSFEDTVSHDCDSGELFG